MKKRLVDVACNRCGDVFRRNLDGKYFRGDGTLTLSSYCKVCQQRNKKTYRGRTVSQLLLDRDPEDYGVKNLSREEIEKVKHLYVLK
jgi:hypothetical protein